MAAPEQRRQPRRPSPSRLGTALFVSVMGNVALLLSNATSIASSLSEVYNRFLKSVPYGEVKFVAADEVLRTEGEVEIRTEKNGPVDRVPFDKLRRLPKSDVYTAVAHLKHLRLPRERIFAMEEDEVIEEVKFDDTFAIRGHVRSRETQGPLPGVRVHVLGREVRTNPNGDFYLDGLPPRTVYKIYLLSDGEEKNDDDFNTLEAEPKYTLTTSLER